MRHRLNLFILTCLAAFLVIITGCQEELEQDILIYDNDFESRDLSQITGGEILNFDESNVLGKYNNGGFRLTLNDIPEHQYVHISFDLLLHDTWDGNTNGVEPDAPDLWTMELNRDLNLKAINNPKFETTFSNGPCDSQLCLAQSYPNVYPFQANPKTGFSGSTWGACKLPFSRTGTSIVTIQKTYAHSDRALIIDFYDRLYQPNVSDAKCDESWSLDNLKVRALKVK